MVPFFFHLYIRVQTVFISSGFCEGNGEEKRHMYGKIIFLNPSKIFFIILYIMEIQYRQNRMFSQILLALLTLG